MPDTMRRRADEASDHRTPAVRRQQHVAGEKIATGFASYVQRMRAWLDLNAPSRRDEIDAPATPPASESDSAILRAPADRG